MAQRRVSVVGIACVLLIATSPGVLQAIPDAADRWILVQTECFDLYSNASLSTTRKIGARLEQLAAVLSATTELTPMRPIVPCRILLFKDEESFRPYRLRSDGTPDSVAGYFIPSADALYLAIDASAKDEALRTAYHEYIHLLVHLNMPYIPLWLNEGIAEFYSTAKIKGSRAQVGFPIEEHRYWLSRYALIAPGALFAMSYESNDYLSGPRRGIVYAESWALTHYLVTRPGTGKRDLAKMLRLLRQGMSSDQALAAAYGLESRDLKPELEAYLDRPSFGYYDIHLPAASEVAEMPARALSSQEVLYVLGDLLVHRTPLQETAAETHLNEVLTQTPEHSGCLLSLGLLYDRCNRVDDATRCFQRAIAANPQDPISHLCYGQHLFNRASGDAKLGDERSLLLEQAAAEFSRAIALDPQNVDSQIGLGKTCRALEHATPEAVSGLTLGLQARPWDLGLLTEVILLKRLQGDRDGAYDMAAVLEAKSRKQTSRTIQQELAAADRRDARDLAGKDDYEGAFGLLQDTARRVSDPHIQEDVAEWLESTKADAKRHADRQQYERARAAAAARQYRLAAATFDSVAAGASDPALRNQAQSAADRIRKHGR